MCAPDEHLQRLSTQTANDEAYQECSAFLRSIGIDNRAEIARIMDIATNPDSIYATFQGKKRESNSMVRLVKPKFRCQQSPFPKLSACFQTKTRYKQSALELKKLSCLSAKLQIAESFWSTFHWNSQNGNIVVYSLLEASKFQIMYYLFVTGSQARCQCGFKTLGEVFWRGGTNDQGDC